MSVDVVICAKGRALTAAGLQVIRVQAKALPDEAVFKALIEPQRAAR